MTVQKIPFKTRARTIDHLGREQIADCPTAISELWKNSYDAYARRVELHIFDGDVPLAALLDNGHGMNKDEFENKWLVVGTDSKIGQSQLTAADRHGLPHRPRQGQKGIGRLSCANLGSLLLLVSKRQNQPYIAALIDWRIFENPFLMLHDIEIPVINFDEPRFLTDNLAQMFDSLMSNIWGSGRLSTNERDERVALAWAAFDELEKKQNKPSTKSAIEGTLISAYFEERHFQVWDVWTGKVEHGTAMFIANISDDLIAQLSQESRQTRLDADLRAQDRLFQTLSNFIDPFVRQNDKQKKKFDEEDKDDQVDEFKTSIFTWNGLLRRPLLDEERTFKVQNLDELEHIIEGQIDSDGVFLGTVKAFGKVVAEDAVIRPAEVYKARSDTACGPFHLRLGSFERDPKNSSHTKEQHAFFSDQASKYAGFMVHRDGLRVMPYGREDNDYFEIEKRRTQHAGRYFWSNRNIFGRVLITREHNPNLKDKAGREGLIDNKASKRFRALVENILIESAKRYFGSESDTRRTLLPDINAQHALAKAEADRKKITALQRKRFRLNLKSNAPLLEELLDSVEALADEIVKNTQLEISEIAEFKRRVSNLIDHAKDFHLSPVPTSLGTLEEAYRVYRRKEKLAHARLSEINDSINIVIDRLSPRSPHEIALQQQQSLAAQLHSRIRKWSIQGRSLLAEESGRFNQIVEERNKAFHQATSPIIDEITKGNIGLSKALSVLDEQYQEHYRLNSDIFAPYLASLQNMREAIDFENLLTHSLAESAKLNEEIQRLHSLAQLGITVEIIGHEIEALDLTLAEGLRSLPDEIKQTTNFRSMMIAQQSLSDRWRFLSPLKLSGEKYRAKITGTEIFEYIQNFLGSSLYKEGTSLEATSAFKEFSVFEQPSRIYPVFINLVNNSRYWVHQNDADKKRIILDAEEKDVFVCDTGPGVESDYIEQLFTLFFTRKARGGRGIGLYLCRSSLLAGGHTISYEINPEKKRLQGANFKISFKDTENV